MMPGGNLRWQIRVRPTAGHRECTPKMATPLDSTSMMKLVEVHAELNVFPGVVGGEWSSLRTAERGCAAEEAPAEPQRLTKTRWISRFSGHQITQV
jgi:hypothetical protein